MSYKNLQYLLRKLKVSIFWQMKQKCDILSLKVVIVKSVCIIFFASPFNLKSNTKRGLYREVTLWLGGLNSRPIEFSLGKTSIS